MTTKVQLVAKKDGLKTLFEQREELANFALVNISNNKEDALDYLEKNDDVDIVMFTDNTPSSTNITSEGFISEVRQSYPNIRIIFFGGDIAQDPSKANMLSDIVKNGVYDIVLGARPSVQEVIDVLKTPRTYAAVQMFEKNISAVKNDVTGTFDNVISFYSVKPGTGKSFVAFNVATAIAKFGQVTPDGKRPRVAIIDADLSSLSIGALMHIKNSKYDMCEALRLVKQVVNDNGEVVGTPEAIESIKRDIWNCFPQYPEVSNLYALIAEDFPLEERVTINPRQFYFLLECIYKVFDIVIVDMNSSMEHTTTGPLFAASNRIYFLTDPDFNNVKNNIRYQGDLTALGINKKTKYIMNKYISKELQDDFSDTLKYNISEIRSAGLNITEVIPMVDPVVMNNRAMSGKPLILDTSANTKLARRAILKIANENWKIDKNLVFDYEHPEKETKSVTKIVGDGAKGGQTVNIEELYPGYVITVTETTNSNYSSTVNNSTNLTYTYTAPANAAITTAVYTNEFIPYYLTINKTVKGSMGDKKKAFTFKVQLPSSYANKMVSTSAGTLTADNNAVITTTLSHGGSVTINGLSKSDAEWIKQQTNYSVSENDYSNEGYSTSYETSSSGTTMTVSVVNTNNPSVPTAVKSNNVTGGMAVIAGILMILIIVSLKRKGITE